MVIVECDLDEYVVRQTGMDPSNIHHVAGKGKVISKLIRHPDNNLGMIDKDPYSPQPSKLKQYSEIQKYGNISLLQHYSLDELKLIVVDPRIEEWLLERAAANNIEITNYGYPYGAEKIHDIPKIEQQQDFQEFFNDLFDVDEEFLTLKDWMLKYGP